MTPLTAEDCIKALLQHGLDCKDGCSPGHPPVCAKGKRIMAAKHLLEQRS